MLLFVGSLTSSIIAALVSRTPITNCGMHPQIVLASFFAPQVRRHEFINLRKGAIGPTRPAQVKLVPCSSEGPRRSPRKSFQSSTTRRISRVWASASSTWRNQMRHPWLKAMPSRRLSDSATSSGDLSCRTGRADQLAS
jgi:hypothetical protein